MSVGRVAMVGSHDNAASSRRDGSAVLAAMVAGAERAAVMHWMRAPSGSLVATVREAIEQAVAGIGGPS
jgi:hypothetical protein